jgi:uncharacterized protein
MSAARLRTVCAVAGLCLGSVAFAQTSSWSSSTDPAVKKAPPAATKPGAAAKSQKAQPQPKPHSSDPLSRFQKGPVGEPAARNEAAPTAEDAAFLAFEQGQYLTALTLAGERAKLGDAAAATLVGRIYDEGLGINKDPVIAARWFKQGADLGDIEAAFALGVMFAEGRGVDKDRTIAGQMFERAAAKQHALANYNLAQLFLSGQGKPENPYRAAQHLAFAAQKGVAAAQYDLATLYQKGHGVPADAYEASRWLRRAAEQGMPEAEYDYAVMLLRGNGLNADMPRALDYLKSAANKGLAGAQNRLANVYAEGIMLLDKDLVEAAKWRMLARDGNIADDALDAIVAKLPRADREKAEKAAQTWRDETALDRMQ